MTPQQVFVAVAVIVLVLAVIGLVVGKRRKGKALTGLALAFVLAGLIFAENRVVGYALLGIGVVLAVVDMVRKFRGKAGDQTHV